PILRQYLNNLNTLVLWQVLINDNNIVVVLRLHVQAHQTILSQRYVVACLTQMLLKETGGPGIILYVEDSYWTSSGHRLTFAGNGRQEYHQLRLSQRPVLLAASYCCQSSRLKGACKSCAGGLAGENVI